MAVNKRPEKEKIKQLEMFVGKVMERDAKSLETGDYKRLTKMLEQPLPSTAAAPSTSEAKRENIKQNEEIDRFRKEQMVNESTDRLTDTFAKRSIQSTVETNGFGVTKTDDGVSFKLDKGSPFNISDMLNVTKSKISDTMYARSGPNASTYYDLKDKHNESFMYTDDQFNSLSESEKQSVRMIEKEAVALYCREQGDVTPADVYKNYDMKLTIDSNKEQNGFGVAVNGKSDISYTVNTNGKIETFPEEQLQELVSDKITRTFGSSTGQSAGEYYDLKENHSKSFMYNDEQFNKLSEEEQQMVTRMEYAAVIQCAEGMDTTPDKIYETYNMVSAEHEPKENEARSNEDFGKEDSSENKPVKQFDSIRDVISKMVGVGIAAGVSAIKKDPSSDAQKDEQKVQRQTDMAKSELSVSEEASAETQVDFSN